MDKADGAVKMDGLIIPCWHMFVMFGLGWIPIGADIAIGGLENHQNLAFFLADINKLVAPRNMADQPAAANVIIAIMQIAIGQNGYMVCRQSLI